MKLPLLTLAAYNPLVFFLVCFEAVVEFAVRLQLRAFPIALGAEEKA